MKNISLNTKVNLGMSNLVDDISLREFDDRFETNANHLLSFIAGLDHRCRVSLESKHKHFIAGKQKGIIEGKLAIDFGRSVVGPVPYRATVTRRSTFGYPSTSETVRLTDMEMDLTPADTRLLRKECSRM